MLALALVTGIFASLFGIGGGSIIVPLLVILFSFGPKSAIGTGAICVPFIAFSSSLSHSKFKAVDRETGLRIAAGTVPGAFIGAALTSIAPSDILMGFLALILIAAGLKIFIHRNSGEKKMHRNLAILLGLGAGITAGMLGIGGGIIIVPALLFIGVSPHRSVATSSFVIIFTGTASALTHGYLGQLDYPTALLLVLGAVPGTKLGAELAHITKADHLKAILGAFLILMAARILWGMVF